MAPAITGTYVDFSLLRCYGIHLRAVSQQATKLLYITSLNITRLKLLPHLPGANELNEAHVCHHCVYIPDCFMLPLYIMLNA